MTPYYRLYHSDKKLSCILPDDSAFAAEYARLMAHCQKETLFAVRFRPKAAVVVASYDPIVNATIVE